MPCFRHLLHVCVFAPWCDDVGVVVSLGPCGEMFLVNNHPPASLQSKEGSKVQGHRRTEHRPLKTKWLRDYTIKNHSSIPPNNTYATFERFAHVVEEISGMEKSVGTLAASQDSLQGDIDALVSIYNEKEAWYKEEHESVKHELSQLKYEYRKIDSLKKHLKEDVQAVGANLAGVAGRYIGLQSHYERLSKELSEELQWIQDLMGNFWSEGSDEGYAPGSFGCVFQKDLNELLNRSCYEEFLAALNLGMTKSSQ